MKACSLHTSATSGLERKLSAILLGGMFSLPFLQPSHYQPIASFWAQWWAILLGTILCLQVMRKADAWTPLEVPGIAWLPLCLTALILLQIATGQILFPERGLLYAFMLIWSFLMAVTGRRLFNIHGLDWIASVGATALLCSALLNAVAAMLQGQGLAAGNPWVFHNPRMPYVGNLAQSNHLNDHLWMGLASLLFLHLRGRCGTASLLAGSLALATASYFTGSRSSLLYGAAFIALALWQHRMGNSGKEGARLARATLLVAALPLLALAISALIDFLRGDAGRTVAGFLGDGAGTTSRIDNWRRTWEVIIRHPWLGSGAGDLPWHFYRSFDFHPQPNTLHGVAEHSHNLVVQLLAEFGFVAPLVLVALGASWLWNLRRLPVSPALWWLLAVLAVSGLHSMVEYPLWYAYFLGPVAVLLGTSDVASCRRGIGRPGAILIVATCLAIVAGLAEIRREYRVVQSRVNPWLSDSRTTLGESLSAPDIVGLWQRSILKPYIGYSMAFAIEVSPEAIDTKTRICAQATRVYPHPFLILKCAAIDALAGRQDLAAAELVRFDRAYPGAAKKQVDAFAELAGRYPALLPFRDALEQLAADE